MKALIPALILFFIPGFLYGQEEPLQPFVCDGTFYQAIAPFLASTLHEVVVDPETEEILFVELPAGTLGTSINPIGYRVTDNFIYGISPTNLHLFRIGADGRGERLLRMDALDGTVDFPAGAITPDGRFFILLGIVQGPEPGDGYIDHLVTIDLESPDYEVNEIPVFQNTIQCFDIAFDPTDGQLYGFDATSRQLVRINPLNGAITKLPVVNTEAESVGSLFFDPFGNLFAYGNKTRTEKQNTYFRIDKSNGRALPLAGGPEAQLTDGCSCPYTVGMQAEIQPKEALACTNISLTLDLVNSSGEPKSGLTLLDTFPPGFTIIAVETDLSATITQGIGGQVLRMENLSLPLGNSQVRVIIQAGSSQIGTFENQAILEGLPEILGSQVRSDNSGTLVRADPVTFTVHPLDEENLVTQISICPGDTARLESEINGLSYQWDNGDTTRVRQVVQPGTYRLDIGTSCYTIQTVFEVRMEELSLRMPPDAVLALGDSLQLKPLVFPFDMDYTWTGGQEDLSCYDCPQPIAKPYSNTDYLLQLFDPLTGCSLEGSMQVMVTADRKIFIPNAFSPNGDGQNDYFFPQSKVVEYIRNFSVFSRWGERVFHRSDLHTNDLGNGWDGTARGTPLTAGPYLYHLEVVFRDQVVKVFRGEINLVR